MDANGGGIHEDCSHLFFFGANKAGMTDDRSLKEERDKVVFEMSRNSQFFLRAQKIDEKNRSRVEDMLRKIAKLSPYQLRSSRQKVEATVLELEAKRSFKRICCVIGTYTTTFTLSLFSPPLSNAGEIYQIWICSLQLWRLEMLHI